MIIILCLWGCRASDYQLTESDKSNIDPEEEEISVEVIEEEIDENDEHPPAEDTQEVAPEDVEPKMKIDASIQHMKWGDQLMRCQIQVAFTRRWFPPREDQEGVQPPTDPPQEAGECVFVRNERMEGNGPPSQDNWFISGELFGPETLYLHSETQTLTLEKTQAEDGLIRYEFSDCRQETFPFGEVFDLEIPPSQGNGAIPESYIEDVISFGPNIQIETPDDIPANNQYNGYGEDGLFFSWSFEDVAPTGAEEKITVRLTNNSNQPWNYDERMECIPDDRYEIDLMGDELTQFTLSEYIGEGIFSIGLNVHGDYYGPDRIDPWGRIVKSRVNIARGGMMELVE